MIVYIILSCSVCSPRSYAEFYFDALKKSPYESAGISEKEFMNVTQSMYITGDVYFWYVLRIQYCLRISDLCTSL